MFSERVSKKFLIQLFCVLLVFCLVFVGIPIPAFGLSVTSYTPEALSSLFNDSAASVSGASIPISGEIQFNGKCSSFTSLCTSANEVRWIPSYKSGYHSALLRGADIPWVELRIPKVQSLNSVGTLNDNTLVLGSSYSTSRGSYGNGGHIVTDYILGYVGEDLNTISLNPITRQDDSYSKTSYYRYYSIRCADNNTYIVGQSHTSGQNTTYRYDWYYSNGSSFGSLFIPSGASGSVLVGSNGYAHAIAQAGYKTSDVYIGSAKVAASVKSPFCYLGSTLQVWDDVFPTKVRSLATTSLILPLSGNKGGICWKDNTVYLVSPSGGSSSLNVGSTVARCCAYNNACMILLKNSKIAYYYDTTKSLGTAQQISLPASKDWVGFTYYPKESCYILVSSDGYYCKSNDCINWSNYGGGAPNQPNSYIFTFKAFDSNNYEFSVYNLSMSGSNIAENLQYKYVISKVDNSQVYSWYVSEEHDYTGASEVIQYFAFREDASSRLKETRTVNDSGYSSTYADGSSSVTTVNADGSSLTVKNNVDGTVSNIETAANGDYVSVTVENDGTVTTVTSSGSTLETSQVHPDGSISVIRVDSEGNTVTEITDSLGVKTTVINFTDGTVSTKTESPGNPITTVIVKPDGTSITVSEDGDEKTTVTRKPDGTEINKVEKAGEPTVTTEVSAEQVKTITENLDGSIVTVIEPLDGEKVIIEVLPDGTKRTTTEHADGTATVIVESPDGSIETISVAVDGSSTSVIIHADGSTGTSTESIDGIKVTNESDLDGTSRVITSDANSGEKIIVETKPDGSSSKKKIQADGDLDEVSVDALGNKTHFHEDKYGNKETTLLDISGVETTIKEDTHGNKSTLKDFGDGSFTQEDLDSEGNKETKHTRVDGSTRLEKDSSDGSKLVSEVSPTGTEVYRKETDTSGNKKEMSFDETTNVSTTEYDNTFNVTVIDTNDGSKVSIISLNGSDFISAVVDEDSHKITITESDSSGNPLATADTVEVYYEFSVNEFTMTYDIVALEVTNLNSGLAACLPNIVLSVLARDGNNLKCVHLNYSGLDIPEVAFLKDVTMPSLSFTKADSNSFVDMLKDLYLGDDLGTAQAVQEQLLSLDVNEDMKLDIADIAELLAE